MLAFARPDTVLYTNLGRGEAIDAGLVACGRSDLLQAEGIIATSIFTFILAWNDYIFTRILIASDELKTLPVGVQDLFHSALIDWGLIMAAGMMITIPALIFFVTVQRYLIRGWGAGAVKG